MKLRISRESGGTLLITLSLCIVLGTALASYLKLVEYQNRSVMRSQFWNASIPAAEAGIEEALAHLNYIGDFNRATNGWQLQDGLYKMSRTLGDSRYEVAMDGQTQPSITAKGYVKEPLNGTEIKRTVLVQTTRYGSAMRGIVAKQFISMNGNARVDSFDSQNPTYNTNGRYDPAKPHDNGFAGAVAGSVYAEGDGIWGYVGTGPTGTATGNVGDNSWLASHSGVQGGHYSKDLNINFLDVTVPFNGGGMAPSVNQTITVTNYTYLTTQSTSMIYPIPDPGNVVTNTQTYTSATKPFVWSGTLVTNTAASTSTNYPVAGSYVGNVVTRVVVTGANNGGNGKNAVSTTYYDYVAITGYTYTTTTYTYNTVTTNASTTSTSYAYVTGGGNYQANSLTMNGQEELLVTGDTTLYITGDFSMSGQSQITIMPGASLRIYVGGNASLSGNGVMNLGQDSTKYSLYGLPTCAKIDISGNASFTGVIYAPQAALKLNGSGNNVYDISGAVVANTAYFKGNFQFHYDERLGRDGGKSQYRVAYWSEI
jgi:hypothetical protein